MAGLGGSRGQTEIEARHSRGRGPSDDGRACERSPVGAWNSGRLSLGWGETMAMEIHGGDSRWSPTMVRDLCVSGGFRWPTHDLATNWSERRYAGDRKLRRVALWYLQAG
ncbi:hypothetical protein STAS_01992 [Striga asiatica]|uniref:Uncharacterized protein n=1 Tax=Striga asiatica TaxID=4170 RepID=A0A5A7P0M5_STRAF|nr:hypothetical protein STAS_01992 [Striga asiatica]